MNVCDNIRVSLIGGAIVDALGYMVEFWSKNQINRRIFKIHGNGYL